MSNNCYHVVAAASLTAARAVARKVRAAPRQLAQVRLSLDGAQAIVQAEWTVAHRDVPGACLGACLPDGSAEASVHDWIAAHAAEWVRADEEGR